MSLTCYTCYPAFILLVPQRCRNNVAKINSLLSKILQIPEKKYAFIFTILGSKKSFTGDVNKDNSSFNPLGSENNSPYKEAEL